MRANPIKYVCPSCGGRKDFKAVQCHACKLASLGTVQERVYAKIWCDLATGCCLWTAATAGSGYGVFGINGRMFYAHRLVWEWAHGPIPEGMFVCHTCDTPPCVRTDHLFLGTAAENTADMVMKGRALTGERNPSSQHPERVPRGEGQWNARLTEADVRTIRERYAAGGVSQSALGREFGVSQTIIGAAIRRRTWKHVL